MYMNDDIEISSNWKKKSMNLRENSGEGNRYEENSTEENSDEENSDEKKFKNTQMLKLFFKGYKKNW